MSYVSRRELLRGGIATGLAASLSGLAPHAEPATTPLLDKGKNGISTLTLNQTELERFRAYAESLFRDGKIIGGNFDGKNIQVLVRKFASHNYYSLEMRILRDQLAMDWVPILPYDRFVDVGIKGNLLGIDDFVRVWDYQNKKIIFFGPQSSYRLERWEKSNETKKCEPLIGNSVVFAPDYCISDRAHYSPYDNEIKLSEAYDKIGHKGLLEMGKNEIRHYSRMYEIYLRRLINYLVSRGLSGK